MTVEYHPAFRVDVLEAAEFLDKQQANLGDEFVDEVEACVARLLREPCGYRKVRGHIRRHHLKRFKKWSVRYRYVEHREAVRILGLYHDSRDPASEPLRQ